MNTTVLQAVTFGREGDSDVYQIFGWSAPESGFTWSVGKECGLAFPAMDAPAGFMIELEYAIFRPLDLEVRVNDAAVASCAADAPGTLVWRAPAIRGPAPVRLTFRHPNSQKPCDIVDSDDGRALGLQCRRLRLLRLEQPDMNALAAASPDAGGQTCSVPAFPDLASLERIYRDEASIHQQIYDACERAMAMDSRLRAHREHVERNELGFGDRASYWLWKLIIDAMPAHFKCLEIGVYKGQVTSLLAMLAMTAGKIAESLAVTPLGGFGDKYSHYEDADYLAAIRSIEAWSGINVASRARIIRGFSDDDGVKRQCREVAPFDLVYIDGCHDYHVITSDIITYSEMLQPGGLLVIDDASAGLDLPAGIWPGHADVGRAVREIFEPMRGFTRIVAVGQLLVWRKTTAAEQPAPAGIGEVKRDQALPVGEASCEILFGADGNDAPYLISGWGGPEPGFRWSVEAASCFTMPASNADFFILELDCRPCTAPGLPPVQRLVLRVNGQPAGTTELNGRAIIAFAFPKPDGAGDSFTFALEFPDAAPPANVDAKGDRRVMAIAMLRARLFPARAPVAVAPRVSALDLAGGNPDRKI
jgi:Methyltransferase domain